MNEIIEYICGPFYIYRKGYFQIDFENRPYTIDSIYIKGDLISIKFDDDFMTNYEKVTFLKKSNNEILFKNRYEEITKFVKVGTYLYDNADIYEFSMEN